MCPLFALGGSVPGYYKDILYTFVLSVFHDYDALTKEHISIFFVGSLAYYIYSLVITSFISCHPTRINHLIC